MSRGFLVETEELVLLFCQKKHLSLRKIKYVKRPFLVDEGQGTTMSSYLIHMKSVFMQNN